MSSSSPGAVSVPEPSVTIRIDGPLNRGVSLPLARGQPDLDDRKLRHGRVVHPTVLCDRRGQRRGRHRVPHAKRPCQRREQVICPEDVVRRRHHFGNVCPFRRRQYVEELRVRNAERGGLDPVGLTELVQLPSGIEWITRDDPMTVNRISKWGWKKFRVSVRCR
jgi:hypothetical protein